MSLKQLSERQRGKHRADNAKNILTIARNKDIVFCWAALVGHKT
jgi:hypothetical protein